MCCLCSYIGKSLCCKQCKAASLDMYAVCRMTGSAIFKKRKKKERKKWKPDSCAGVQLLTLQMQGREVWGRCKKLKNGGNSLLSRIPWQIADNHTGCAVYYFRCHQSMKNGKNKCNIKLVLLLKTNMVTVVRENGNSTLCEINKANTFVYVFYGFEAWKMLFTNGFITQLLSSLTNIANVEMQGGELGESSPEALWPSLLMFQYLRSLVIYVMMTECFFFSHLGEFSGKKKF